MKIGQIITIMYDLYNFLECICEDVCLYSCGRDQSTSYHHDLDIADSKAILHLSLMRITIKELKEEEICIYFAYWSY